MATWLLSKLDIDVLVTLSMSGPAEADHPRPSWRPSFRYRETSWPESPHALGEILWRANADAVLDSGREDEEDEEDEETRRSRTSSNRSRTRSRRSKG